MNVNIAKKKPYYNVKGKSKVPLNPFSVYLWGTRELRTHDTEFSF